MGWGGPAGADRLSLVAVLRVVVAVFVCVVWHVVAEVTSEIHRIVLISLSHLMGVDTLLVIIELGLLRVLGTRAIFW